MIDDVIMFILEIVYGLFGGWFEDKKHEKNKNRQ